MTLGIFSCAICHLHISFLMVWIQTFVHSFIGLFVSLLWFESSLYIQNIWFTCSFFLNWNEAFVLFFILIHTHGLSSQRYKAIVKIWLASLVLSTYHSAPWSSPSGHPGMAPQWETATSNPLRYFFYSLREFPHISNSCQLNNHGEIFCRSLEFSLCVISSSWGLYPVDFSHFGVLMLLVPSP